MGRFVVVVLDGVGVGALPDAKAYGDEGADTLGNLSRIVPLRLPFLRRMGLGNILPVMGVAPVSSPAALPGRLQPLSVGKDTTVGHWELMGLVTAEAFPTYPDGFPEEVMRAFTTAIGREALGNRAASGTEIISQLGDEHVATGRPIVYTSADSVFQVAAHVDVVPLEQLYAWCQAARELLQGPHGVARVIARPFAGHSGAYTRTSQRRDLSLPPPGRTYLDALAEEGVPVIGVGKIAEIFGGRGVSLALKTESNTQNVELVRALVAGCSRVAEFREGLLFTNLVDFDTTWGHRNDVEGFAHGLEQADGGLEKIAAALRAGDRLVLTADHGVDPTTPSTDHSREYAPVLLYPPPAAAPRAVYEGMFADVGATAYEWLTQRERPLGGDSIDRLWPGRGWRRPTPTQSETSGRTAGMPGRVGGEEAAQAARWLRKTLGPAPDVAIVLGSGLVLHPEASAAKQRGNEAVPYGAVPHWRTGAVVGHPHVLTIWTHGGQRIGLLSGRVHEYEGFDLSEVQLPVRTLAAWGVGRVMLTTASGGVSDSVVRGGVVVVDKVLDFQYPEADGRPGRLTATSPVLLEAAQAFVGTHASVPGPQYESPAELRALRTLDVVTVSMSPAGELRAALDEGLDVAVVAVVTNVGDTCHAEVLARSAESAEELEQVVLGCLACWRIRP
jgi:phosphopentomutase